MTSREKAVVQALIAVAWSDGEMKAPEAGVIEGLLTGFDATAEEETELLEWAKSPRSLRDVDVAALGREDRELLLSNAALLVQADGVETAAEKQIIRTLAAALEFDEGETRQIVASVRGSALGARRGAAT